ncbi:TPA: hypothetical protein MCD06_004384 [Klebsiella pneumoniae]|nr:hypothetical protein [Klebsiella pneumoniae]
MKLTKRTAVEIREALNSKDLPGIATAYKEKGLTFTRFIWDAYHSIGHANTREIIARNNDVKVVGEYPQAFPMLKEDALGGTLQQVDAPKGECYSIIDGQYWEVV